MGIQKCKNCGTKFEYKDLLKPWGGYPDPLICKNCGAHHALTPISRMIISVLVGLPIFFILFLSAYMGILLRFLVYFIFIAIIKALSPFILRYELANGNEK